MYQQPQVTRHPPVVNLPIPSSTVTLPLPSPIANIPRVNLHVPSPRVDIPLPLPTPAVTLPKVNLPVPSPKVNLPVPSPKVNIPLPLPTPTVTLPKVNIPLPSPSANIPLPLPTVILPKINIPLPSPKVNIPPPPTVNTPLAISLPSPKVNTPLPSPRVTLPVSSPKVPINIFTNEYLSPTELFVETIIAEQDADIMDEKEYLGYVKYLLNDESKYDIFSRIFPDNTCANVNFHLSANPKIYPNEGALIDCIRNGEYRGKSIAVSVSYNNHANMLWVDTKNKIINRYDPQVHADVYGQNIMDNKVREYFKEKLPEYMYIGNTLDDWQCVRGAGRIYKSDYYCQDYSLLYAINRIKGMSHEEAAFDLVSRGKEILVDLADLLCALSYRIRNEIGKPVPDKFTNWQG